MARISKACHGVALAPLNIIVVVRLVYHSLFPARTVCHAERQGWPLVKPLWRGAVTRLTQAADGVLILLLPVREKLTQRWGCRESSSDRNGASLQEALRCTFCNSGSRIAAHRLSIAAIRSRLDILSETHMQRLDCPFVPTVPTPFGRQRASCLLSTVQQTGVPVRSISTPLNVASFL